MQVLVLALLLNLASSFNFKLEYNTPFCILEDMFEASVPSPSLKQEIELSYEIIFESDTAKLNYVQNTATHNKKDERIITTIVQPDATLKEFILFNIKGIIKFPAEQGNLY